jgi:hypothetical protein
LVVPEMSTHHIFLAPSFRYVTNWHLTIPAMHAQLLTLPMYQTHR